MRRLKKAAALCLSLLALLTMPVKASAAELREEIIDTGRTGSLTIYKYDITSSEKDGVWDSSYVSTGVFDQTVNDTLGAGGKENIQGNGQTSYGYAIAGVEFSYLKIADIVQYTDSTEGAHKVEVLYGIPKDTGAPFLEALGLPDGASRFDSADVMDDTKYFYQADVLVDALAAALAANPTTVKNALETYLAGNGGTAMPLTDGYGKTTAENLTLGLYLVVETKVPEMVVSTTDPFLVSLPMTSINGTNATDGGTRWIYDVTLYPKNETGMPTLEKTLRESKDDTGKHEGSASIDDGYAELGTASDGDVVDYQILSRLPSITSESTYLTCYTFVDTLSKGLFYNKGDVQLEFFSDDACTNSIAVWQESDGKFTVDYTTSEDGESVMTIAMTEAGLEEINTASQVYPKSTMVNSGYSDCTLRITYQATLHSDDSVIYGDNGNPNQVELTWKRTSQDYYGTLEDDCLVHTYGIDLTKLFSDGKGDFSQVEFRIQNTTDGYFVQAELYEESGIYYVTGHADSKADATKFVPVAGADSAGMVTVKGLEDDTYRITEVRTANGYTLLKEDIEVVISQTDGKATGTVDGKAVTMLEDSGSANAHAPLQVVNTKGFDLPQTGDRGVWMYGLIGVVLMAGSLTSLYLANRKKQGK